MLKKYAGLLLYLFCFLFILYILKRKREMMFYEKHNEATMNSEIFQLIRDFRFFFFTGWNFVAQGCFITIAICDELAKLLNISPNIRKRINLVRSYIFSAIVFPCTLLVVGVFWSLYNYNRELIFPKSVDPFYPLWLNHSVHTAILVPLIIEILLPKEYNFVKFKSALGVLSTFVLVYEILFLSIYYRHNLWLYPIFKELDWIGKIGFLILLYTSSVLFLYIGITLQNRKKIVTIRKSL